MLKMTNQKTENASVRSLLYLYDQAKVLYDVVSLPSKHLLAQSQQ